MEAKEVREILQRRNWTAATLADALFVSQRTVENWLKGGCPTPARQKRLRELLEKARNYSTRGK